MTIPSLEAERNVTQWELVELLLRLNTEERERNLIEQVLPWFRDRSAFFRMLEEDSLIGMIKYATLSWHRADCVVIRQGEIGDCFYVIVRGTVSVYASKTATMVVAQDLSVARGTQERLRFGSELAQLTSGRCFGELSVLKKDGERNASIITDEPTVLICFKRKTFLQFVHEKFANELLRKSGFVQTCPLFKKWPLAYKNLLTECLQIRNVEFGESIIEQGAEFTSLYFVTKGQAKIRVNTAKHLAQYKGTGSKYFDNCLCSYYQDDIDEDDDIYKFPVLLRRRRKEQHGFFANEMRLRPDLDLCVVVAENGMIGDIEAVYDLPTYSTTYHCLEAITLYELDMSSFIRLIVKKNPDTFETMRRIAEAKIRFRNNSIKGGIPLYATLLESSMQRKNDAYGLPNIIPRLPVLKQKKEEKRVARIQQEKTEDQSKLNSQLQKVRMSINPATGEVTVQTTNAVESSRNSALQLEEGRRKHSTIQRDGVKGSNLSAIKGMFQNVEEEDDSRIGTSAESLADTNGDNAKKLMKVTSAAIAAGHFRRGLKRDGDVREKRDPLVQYKNLKKKMQSMSRTTHRVSWNG